MGVLVIRRTVETVAFLALLPWLMISLTVAGFLLYYLAPHWIWLLMFAFVIWRGHWLRRDET